MGNRASNLVSASSGGLSCRLSTLFQLRVRNSQRLSIVRSAGGELPHEFTLVFTESLLRMSNTYRRMFPTGPGSGTSGMRLKLLFYGQ